MLALAVAAVSAAHAASTPARLALQSAALCARVPPSAGALLAGCAALNRTLSRILRDAVPASAAPAEALRARANATTPPLLAQARAAHTAWLGGQRGPVVRAQFARAVTRVAALWNASAAMPPFVARLDALNASLSAAAGDVARFERQHCPQQTFCALARQTLERVAGADFPMLPDSLHTALRTAARASQLLSNTTIDDAAFDRRIDVVGQLFESAAVSVWIFQQAAAYLWR